ncbi:hypothetical protein ACEQPO_21610 [Bacillus sp. SL00103]
MNPSSIFFYQACFYLSILDMAGKLTDLVIQSVENTIASKSLLAILLD